MKAKLVILCAVAAVPFGFLLVAEGYLRAHRGLMPGDLLPAVRLRSPLGTDFDTRSLRGKSSLVVLFLPSCRACRNQIKSLETVSASLPEMSILLVSMSSAAPSLPIPFPIYRDPSGEFVAKARKISVPIIYLVDQNGRILYARTGERPAEADVALFKAMR
jgi:hypothetical protein